MCDSISGVCQSSEAEKAARVVDEAAASRLRAALHARRLHATDVVQQARAVECWRSAGGEVEASRSLESTDGLRMVSRRRPCGTGGAGAGGGGLPQASQAYGARGAVARPAQAQVALEWLRHRRARVGRPPRLRAAGWPPRRRRLRQGRRGPALCQVGDALGAAAGRGVHLPGFRTQGVPLTQSGRRHRLALSPCGSSAPLAPSHSVPSPLCAGGREACPRCSSPRTRAVS